jgi:predicted nucleotidyltransferase
MVTFEGGSRKGKIMAYVTPFDDKILGFMRQHGAERVCVFGSYARNEARPDSDLDLMVWFKEQKSLLGMIRIER